MTLYSYVKKKTRWKKNVARFFSALLVFSGLTILFWAIYPIIDFELSYTPKFSTLVSPLSSGKNTIAQSLPQVLGFENVDYTKASVWFPKAMKLKIENNTTSYFIDVPKVGIEKAQVLIGNDDLSKSLIQFTGVLPGNPGNPVIFGHSTLIWFYNPKDYKTIFSKLPTLRNGDEIFVYLENVTYKYQVIDMKIIFPEDLSVLEQSSDDSYLTLITCVPPGTYLKRLVVKAKLVKI